MSTDNSDKRIEEELELYRSLKDDDRLVNVDGGLTYFLISAQWIQKWRDFITHKGPVPGPIQNTNLAEKIYLQRSVERSDWYKVHDNHVALKENEEAYTLSHDFW